MVFILASASKARSRLLDQVDIKHKVMISDVDENQFSIKDIKDLVQALSLAKSQSVVSKISNNFECGLYDSKYFAVLGCDSLFQFNNEIFGKPSNPDEAAERLFRMSGKSGILHTGHSIVYTSNSKNSNEFCLNISKTVVSTKINFSRFTDLEVKQYVKTNEPMKCAGGFTLEGKGAVFIDSIEGCYSNVIGLSLPWLRSFFNQSKNNF